MTGIEALLYSLLYAYAAFGLGYLIRKLNQKEEKP